MSKDDILAQKALQNSGQGDYGGNGMISNRVIYPAIVVPYGTNDNTEQNRIRARIVSMNDEGKIVGKTSSNNEENYNAYSGRDRGILDEKLVLCVPLFQQFFHIKPQVGEMVYVIVENPTDPASVRYWIGPVITSKLKLKYQAYEDSARIFDKEDRILNTKVNNLLDVTSAFPEESDVAIQGRNNADLILKNREALLISGKLNDDNYTVNLETPSFLRLKQISNINVTEATQPIQKITHDINVNIGQDATGKFIGVIKVKEIKTSFELKNETITYIVKGDVVNWLNNKIKESKNKYKNWSFTSSSEEFKNLPKDCNVKAAINPATPPATNNENLLKKYSQGTIVSTNINIYSPRGKFRGDNIKSFEINNDLKSFGIVADSLHPIMFGDEGIKVIDLIIRLLLEHIHTPEMPLLQTVISDELKKYTVDGNLQNLLSYHIRVN